MLCTMASIRNYFTRSLLFFSLILQAFPLTALSLAPFHDPNYVPEHNVMVHLFEWRWEDIAEECEGYLAPMGFAGVQVSPPSENIIIMNPSIKPEAERPWYERYQPISYNLITRSGDEIQFKDMVHRCNAVGVRIYVDAVINHMTGWFPDGTTGTAGSTFDNNGPSYPSVPYTSVDFNNHTTCPTESGNIENYGDVVQVRNCKLVSLYDINQKQEHVREKIAKYLNNLLAIGVAGFRTDASKHMWPEDLQAIYQKLSNLSTEYFESGLRPLIYQEVIDLGGEAVSANQYVHLGRVTEFKYGMKLGTVFRRRDSAKYLKNFGEEWGLLPSDDALVFIDNHDNQRGHGAGGQDTILTFFDGELYKKASVFMLAWPFGLKRVMSSYWWPRDIKDGHDNNDWIGPPHDTDFNTLPVTINNDGSCGNGWMCEHRWPEITNMVQFSIVAGDEPVVNWWDNGGNQIAFSRGDKAFIAINNEESTSMEAHIKTNLAPGIYCDILSGTFDNSGCKGNVVTVPSDQLVYVTLGGTERQMMAIHEKSWIGPLTTDFHENDVDVTEDFQRTIVLIYKESAPEEHVFIRGGIGNDPECNTKAMKCSIPIKYIDKEYHNEGYMAWKSDDMLLDWYGAEDQQGKYNGVESGGTPLFYITDDPEDSLYYQYNQYGPNYWVMDVEMDCSKVPEKWFELKVFMPDANWEQDLQQNNICAGDGVLSYRKPFTSGNHIAMCGMINVFKYNSKECTVKKFYSACVQ